MLNDSIDNLGHSLLQERMMQQQEQEKAAAQGLKSRELDIEQQRYADANKTAAAGVAGKAAENTQRTWGDTVKMLGGWVKDGIVDPTVAQQKLQAQYSQMPPEAQAAIANHPATLAIQKGQPIWQTANKPEKNATEVTIGGKRFAQTANGALVPLDTEPSRPFSHTTVNPDDPNDRTTQRMSADEYNAYKLDQAMQAEAAAQKAKDEFKPATGFFKDGANADAVKQLQDRLSAASAARQRLEGKSTKANPPAAGNPLPMPSDKTQMVKGKQYSTPRGVATWDGEKFVQ